MCDQVKPVGDGELKNNNQQGANDPNANTVHTEDGGRTGHTGSLLGIMTETAEQDKVIIWGTDSQCDDPELAEFEMLECQELEAYLVEEGEDFEGLAEKSKPQEEPSSSCKTTETKAVDDMNWKGTEWVVGVACEQESSVSHVSDSDVFVTCLSTTATLTTDSWHIAPAKLQDTSTQSEGSTEPPQPLSSSGALTHRDSKGLSWVWGQSPGSLRPRRESSRWVKGQLHLHGTQPECPPQASKIRQRSGPEATPKSLLLKSGQSGLRPPGFSSLPAARLAALGVIRSSSVSSEIKICRFNALILDTFQQIIIFLLCTVSRTELQKGTEAVLSPRSSPKRCAVVPPKPQSPGELLNLCSLSLARGRTAVVHSAPRTGRSQELDQALFRELQERCEQQALQLQTLQAHLKKASLCLDVFSITTLHFCDKVGSSKIRTQITLRSRSVSFIWKEVASRAKVIRWLS
ncbi:hypothetical protein XENOCAPTIV_016710 [Xenoophorus captivus]|uniref:Uncharacterized protein n=1 Tax=Xenoophorus captivus TaxID=1517983 RepID=A0ABV0QEG5_9TELE